MTKACPPSVSHDEAVVKRLRADPEFAAAYLNAALEESAEEPAVLLVALRHVAEAHGMQRVAERTGLNRESLYRALSVRGNPTVKTLSAVLKAVGLQLTTEPLPGRARASSQAQ